MKGWMDKHESGGKMQEYQPNFNTSSISIPKDFVGQGYNTKGRNYSPAWGGQFKDGGWLDRLGTGDIVEKSDATRVSPRQIIDYKTIQQCKDLKNENIASVHQDLQQEDQDQHWWNKRVEGVHFTPEQRDYELQRRATNIVEDEYTPWQEKAKSTAIDLGLSLIPELGGARILSALKGAPQVARSLGETAGEVGSLVGQGAREMGEFYGDALKYSKLGQKFEDIPRSIDELKEIKRIKDRVNTASITDLIEWKKGRMLSRQAPDYTKTYDEFEGLMRKGAETKADMLSYGNLRPITTNDVMKYNKSIEEAFRNFDRLRPTNNQYRRLVSNPKIKVVDDGLMSSSATPERIKLGLTKNNMNEKPFLVGTARNHEVDHFVSYPTTEDNEAIKSFMDFRDSGSYYTGKSRDMSPIEIIDNMENLLYIDKKGTEMKARLGQLKDYLGLSGSEQITMPQLRAALKAANRPERFGMFNNMMDANPSSVWNKEIPVFRRVKDKKKMLDYMNQATHNPVFTAHKDGGKIAKEGAALQLTKLDQLQNFNNFGQSKKGWLEKYK